MTTDHENIIFALNMRPWEKKSSARPWTEKKEREQSQRYSDIYNTRRWRNLRNHFLSKHPLCKLCEEKHIYKPATVVDHIIPMANGGDPWREDNLQALCNRCHAIKTNREITDRQYNAKDETNDDFAQ